MIYNNLTSNKKYQNPKCFARDLKNCSKKISGEHFFSHSILEVFFPDRIIDLSGPKWLPKGETKRISINSFSSNILCENHNSLLSNLDESMKNFISNLLRPNKNTNLIFIDGNVIEKWILKSLCGFMVSGFAHKKFRRWKPPLEWLQILFTSEVIPVDRGLYFLIGPHEGFKDELGLFPLKDNKKAGYITGVGLLISVFPMLFLMEPITEDIKMKLNNFNIIYRPDRLIIKYGNFNQEINFGWQTGNNIEIDVSKFI